MQDAIGNLDTYLLQGCGKPGLPGVADDWALGDESTPYDDLLRHVHVLENGTLRSDRTGTGTIGLFRHRSASTPSRAFPLTITKRVFTRGIIEELLWIPDGEGGVTAPSTASSKPKRSARATPPVSAPVLLPGETDA